MEISFNSGHVQASELSLDQLMNNSRVSEPAKVAEVSRQFEALLVRQILQSAHAVSATPADGKNSTVSGIYEDLVTTHLADAMTRGNAGGIGLGRSLERQLSFELAAPTAVAARLARPESKVNFAHD